MRPPLCCARCSSGAPGPEPASAARSIIRIALCARSAAAGPPAHPAQPGERLPGRAAALGGAVQPDPAAARPPGRAGSAVLSGGGRAARPAHRRAVAQQRAVRRDRAPRPADGGCRLPGADPPAFGRRRACRAVGHGAARPGGFAGAAGLQRHAARARHGQRDRPHGGAGLGARLLALAVRAFGPRRAAGRGLRAHEHDAPVPRLRCPDGAARGDRGASVRSGDGSVRAALHGDALRPDQHLLRGRGGGPEQGPTRPLQGEARRIARS